MADLVLAHTSQLDLAVRAEARELLYAVFDDLTEDDWEHCLGGMHALVREGAQLVGHASVVQRRLLYRGRALRAGYVEGVAVHPDHRRRGHAAAMMAAVEQVARSAYDVAALGATDEAVDVYVGRGWRLAAVDRAVVGADPLRRAADGGRRRGDLRAPAVRGPRRA